MKAIVLPIKPEYAEAILKKEKRYEYRRHLCKKQIDKIVIYATAPVKKIVGEAFVIEKLIDNKEMLWQKTKTFSGIDKHFYDMYFKGLDEACAYSLGEVIAYESPRSLEEFGINFYPQSYVYVKE